MEIISEFFKMIFVFPEKVRWDGFALFIMGMVYYTYLHKKHDHEIVKGLKGENGLWEAPEYVVYIWTQSFPFVLFADQFLGLILSEGMMYIFTLILFFAIMGRAGIEMMLTLKSKMLSSITPKKEEETPTA